MVTTRNVYVTFSRLPRAAGGSPPTRPHLYATQALGGFLSRVPAIHVGPPEFPQNTCLRTSQATPAARARGAPASTIGQMSEPFEPRNRTFRAAWHIRRRSDR